MAFKRFKKKKKPKGVVLPENPTSVEDYGYKWLKLDADSEHEKYDYKLVDMKSNGKFKFIDQEHYEAISEMVKNYIQEVMAKDFDLQVHNLPLEEDYPEGYPKVPIFVSKNYDTADKLLLLIQGLGQVRAGQWARSLCINEDLSKGSILPYLVEARSRGYAIIVFNPNKNEGRVKNRMVQIRHNKSPENHACYVYDKFVASSKAKDVVIIAHSYGGIATLNLLYQKDELLSRLRCVALTDSVHPRLWSRNKQRFDEELLDYYDKNVCNWVRSTRPVGTPRKKEGGCPTVSAGHTEHEWTSAASIDSVWDYIDAKVSGKEVNVTPSKKSKKQKKGNKKNKDTSEKPKNDEAKEKEEKSQEEEENDDKGGKEDDNNVETTKDEDTEEEEENGKKSEKTSE
mmetsp:Transcript_29758/g.33186  ORF Transcript_29758/g.33186 Transcript_29758/m.33186 type:complete len:398 (+) Transcript_29758:81-1274(+)